MTCSSDVIKCYNENKFKELISTVGKLSISTILDLLQTNLHTGSSDDSLALLKGIILGCERDSIKRSLALSGAFKEVIKILGNASSKDKHHGDLICILNHEVSNLSPESLVEISSSLVEMVRNDKLGQGQPLKILSKILETAPQHTSLTLEKTSEVVCGAEYKKYVVEEISSMTWKPSTIFPIIEMFKDISLTPDETKIVINKCLDQLSSMNGQTLPPLIYQLIALATACNKLDPVIKGILIHFNKLDLLSPQVEDSLATDVEHMEADDNTTTNIADLKSMEGTVLLYFSNTLRQNHDLGKVIMKLLKGTRESASPESVSEFFLSMALTLTQDSRFQEDAMSGLRLLVLKCFQDAHKTNERKWLKDHRQPLTDINKVLLSVVKNSLYGWDHVISGIVDLGFNLMASYGPKQGPFKRTFDPEHHKTVSPQQNACDLGSHLLARTFKLHQIARRDIVSQVINRILICGNSPAYLYIDLLKAIVKSYPQLLLQAVPQVKNMLDNLPLMHEYNAKKLLSALLPLLKISASLRDGLMLTLRKSLSSRQRESRHMAVHGFLMFLKSFPLSEITSLSQISSQSSQSIFSMSTQSQTDVHSQGSPPRSNELLCLEILQVLKRCLKQQASVRCQLYAGLTEVVKHNPRLAPFILNNLVKQFKLYYESVADILPPLNLSACISTSQDKCVEQEPLPVLITSIYTCLQEARNRQTTLGDDDEILDDVTNESIREIFDSVTIRMCKSEMDDYQLEKTSEYGNSTKTGQKNASLLCLFMNVHQVLMGYNFTCCDLTDDSVHHILQLHQSYQKAADFTQSLKNPDLCGKNLIAKQMSAMSATNLCQLIHTLFCDESIDNESAIEALSSSESFLKYSMNFAHEMLISAKDSSHFPGVGCDTKLETYSCVTKLARACLHKFMLEKNEPARCPVTLQCLQCFHVSIQYTNIWHKSKLSSFLAEICGEDADGTQGGDAVSKLIKRFQRIVMSFLAPENQPLSALGRKILPEVLSLMESLFEVASTFSNHETLQQCTEWFYKLCVEYKIEETNATKLLLHNHLHSTLLMSPYPETCFRDLSFDVRIELGSFGNAELSEGASPTYQLVTTDNAHHVLVAIAVHAENLISDCEWLLHHLKGRLVAHGCSKEELVDDDDSLHEARRKAEGSICSRVCAMAVGMLELAQCACQSAANVDNVIRTFVTVFTFLTNLSKYYQWLYGQGLGHVPSRFEKLSNFVGSELMKPIYLFINYAETAQTERLESVKAKQDSKKGKKKSSATSVSTTGRAKVLREMKGIARLVYAIEQHEHHLILLGRKAKIDFMRFHHLATSRDFRIHNDVLRISLAEREALANKESSRNEDDGNNDDENVEPSPKRVRTDS